MSANVETMAYRMTEKRDVPWHGLGRPVGFAMSSGQALKEAQLDWKVNSQPMFIKTDLGMIEIPNTIANVRDSDNSVLGVVTGRYSICQNEEAFAFTDNLLGNGVKYETAGSLNNGKTVWMLAKMPETEILGDKMENYIVFTNSHDGKGSIKVACTSVRVVCANTLNIALAGAKRSWSTKHMGDIGSRMVEAHRTLQLASKYTEALKHNAEKLATKKFSDVMFTSFVENLMPIEDESTDRQKLNIEGMREDLILRYKAPDLANIHGTAWGILNAVSDFETHRTPLRITDSHKEKLFASMLNGFPFLDKATELIS